MEKHKIGKIEFSKGGWNSSSESIFPIHISNTWWVNIPILKSEKKKGSYTTGIGFENEGDAQRFSRFLKEHLKKYIMEIKKETLNNK